MQRIVVFLHYDPNGRVDDGVTRLLDGLRPHAARLHVVSNGRLTSVGRSRVERIADVVQERENEGFDVGGYRAALEQIGGEATHYDELLLTNYTNIGPVGEAGFGPVFERMDARQVDFWGLTEHAELTPDPYTHRGTLPVHLQSNWIAVRRRLVASRAWADYWAQMPEITSYADSIRLHEARFTEHFVREGFRGEPVFPAAPFGVANPSMEAPLALVEAGCPVVKRRLFFHDPVELDHRGVDAAAVFAAVVEAGYPGSTIVGSVAPVTEPRALAVNVGGARVLRPPIRSLLQERSNDPTSDAFVSGALRVRLVDESVWRRLAEDPAELLDDVDVIVQRGASRALVAPEHIVERARADAEAALWEEPTPVAWQFSDHPTIGAVVPLAPHLGTDVLGHGWQGRYAAAADLAARLGLDGPLDPGGPAAPYTGVAAYRTDALRPVTDVFRAQGGWAALVESTEGGASELERLLDLIASRIVAAAGFVTVEAGTIAQFEASYAHLALKTETLTRMLPEGTSEPFRYLRARQHGPFTTTAIGETLVRRAPGLARLLRAASAFVRR